jgi:hypothetical protein
MMPRQEPLRLDQMLLGVIGHCVRQYLEPHAKFPLWDSGLGALAEKAIAHIGVPQHPVISVQVGNLTIPMELVGGVLRYARLLPSGEVDRVGV